MVCNACGKESAIEFKFCPECGSASLTKPLTVRSPDPAASAQSMTHDFSDQPVPVPSNLGRAAISAGMIAFGAFSAISLLVSIIKGLVPIYLLESAGWAGLAWYWQSKRTHSELAKGMVAILAVLVAVGEAVQIVSQAAKGQGSAQTESNAYVYPSASSEADQYPNMAVSSPTLPAADSKQPSVQASVPLGLKRAEARESTVQVEKLSPEAIKRRAFDLYADNKFKEAAPLLDQSCTNGYAYACEKLGYMNQIELGVPGDDSRAAAYYSRTVTLYSDSCSSGSAEGCKALSDLYDDREALGAPHIDKKFLPRKVVVFSKACDAGSAEGCNYLGEMYCSGEDVVEDYSRAESLFAQSCSDKNANGCGFLATRYELGGSSPGYTQGQRTLRQKLQLRCPVGMR
jgi:TPR repeat protein